MKRQKKRLLIYGHYYLPDMASTGQLLGELAQGISDVFEVTVICVVPSYLGTIQPQYKTRWFYREVIDGIKVLRIRVPEFEKNSKISRIRNILGYFLGALAATFRVGPQDYVFSISQPPVLGGLLGVWGKWMKGAKYIYNIQDFNPEQILAVQYARNTAAMKLLLWADKFSCRRSDLVITVGRDLLDTLYRRFPEKKKPKAAVIHNWADENTVYPLPPTERGVVEFRKRYGLENRFVIMYSGNIGLYYDLENLIRVMERFPSGTRAADGREVVFAFVGEGCMLETLMEHKRLHGMENVVFIPYQRKSELAYSLNAGDLHWCVSARGIKGVSCPSKYYGLAAAGRPVLGVLEKGSEIRCLIEDAQSGLCCDPGDYEAVEAHLRWFLSQAGSGQAQQMGMRGYRFLREHLSKERSVGRYITAILDC